MNPSPLKIFELGDAFTSEFPEKVLGDQNLTLHDTLLKNIQNQYPQGLLLKVYRSGFNLIDLNDFTCLMTHDKQLIFKGDDSDIRTVAPSYGSIKKLVRETIKHANKQDMNGRLLVINCPLPELRHELNIPTDIEYAKLKFLNHYSNTIQRAFFDKSIFHEYACNNPLYPQTLIMNFFQLTTEESKQKIQVFIEQAKADYSVLKPTDGTRSEHVHIIEKDKIFSILEEMQQGGYQSVAFKYYLKGLIIQECHLSQLVPLNGKHYFCKGRALFRADFSGNDDKPTVEVLAGYRQLAKSPYENCLNDETAIANLAGHAEGILEFDKEDWQNITELFNRHLPTILFDMKRNDAPIEPLFLGNDNLILAPSSNYADIINQFLKQQFILPTNNNMMLEKIYYHWNTTIEESSNQMFIRKFVIDITGINQTYKNMLNYDPQSQNEFVKNAVATSMNPERNVLYRDIAFPYKSSSDVKIFLSIYTLTLLCTSLVSNKKEPMIHLAFFLLPTVLAYVIDQARAYINHQRCLRNTFFQPVSSSTVSEDAYNLQDDNPIQDKRDSLKKL